MKRGGVSSQSPGQSGRASFAVSFRNERVESPVRTPISHLHSDLVAPVVPTPAAPWESRCVNTDGDSVSPSRP